MTNNHIRVLLIEDNPGHVRLIEEMLASVKGIPFHLQPASKLSTGQELLAGGGIDVVLLDLSLPDSHGLDTFDRIHTQAKEVPIVVLTGTDDEALAVHAVQQGAQDYLVKRQINGPLVARSIRYAIERHRLLAESQRYIQELQASKVRFHHIIEKNADGIIIVDRRGRIRFVNPAMEMLFNRKAEELLDELFGFPMVINESTEINVITQTGKVCIVEMRVVETEWENEVAYLASLRDITERKQANQALRESEQKFRSVVLLSHNAIILTDSRGTIILWNKGAETIFGYTEEEVLGKPLALLMPERYRNTYQKGLERFRSTGASQIIGKTIKLRGLRKDGQEFPLELSLATWETEEGTFYSGTISDITERVQAEAITQKYAETLEQKVRERTVELEAASRTQSEFLANMSHELRTPLNAIIGFSELLQEKHFGPLAPNQEKYVEYILSSGEHLLSLINDILDLSKIEAGKEELTFSEFSITDALQGGLVLIKEKALRGGIHLETDIRPRMATMVGDERKFKQILYNLLSNAAKFTPEGGSICLTADLVDIGELKTLSIQSGAQPPQTTSQQFIRVSVADTGIGINPADQTQVFESFYQVKEGMTNKPPGTGLGLCLCKQFVEMHGGYIWVESEGPGEGSRFSFALPIKPLGDLIGS